MIAVKQVELPRTASDKNDTRQHTVVQALKMESETLKDLDHPNIVQYLGFEETPSNWSMWVIYALFTMYRFLIFPPASWNMFLVVQLVVVSTDMGSLMTMLRDHLLLKF